LQVGLRATQIAGGHGLSRILQERDVRIRLRSLSCGEQAREEEQAAEEFVSHAERFCLAAATTAAFDLF